MIEKIVHLAGSSEHGWQQAAEEAVKDAAKTIKNITSITMTDLSADVENGEIKRYNASIELSFVIDESLRHAV